MGHFVLWVRGVAGAERGVAGVACWCTLARGYVNRRLLGMRPAPDRSPLPWRLGLSE